jgi:hypothetical protein
MEWYNYVIGAVSVSAGLLAILVDDERSTPIGLAMLILGIIILMGYR